MNLMTMRNGRGKSWMGADTHYDPEVNETADVRSGRTWLGLRCLIQKVGRYGVVWGRVCFLMRGVSVHGGIHQNLDSDDGFD